MNWLRTAGLVVLTALSLGSPGVAEAAVNAARGGIGGIDNGTLVGGDGTGEARIELFSTRLALTKQARDAGGTVLPDGGAVTPGQELYFVLYVDNPTDFPAAGLRLIDQLDEAQFTYVSGTLEQTLVPSGSDAATIWGGTWTPWTDAAGAAEDSGSAVDTGGPPGADRITVGDDPGQPNQALDVPANSLRAIRFRVRVN